MPDPQKDNLSDVPDHDDLEDEAFPPLPPPYSPGQRGGEEQGELFGDAEDGELSKLADVPAAKPKGVKRPQPKLDSQRLVSERGLPALRSLFEDVRFKGKGHEAEDLRLLVQRMENWAHRLFPKLQFEDFIEKVEKLGGKKEVQTCLKRIRLDMPLTHEDFQDKDGEMEVPPELPVFEDLDPFSSQSSVHVHSTPAPPAPTTPSLSEEQLRQIELNRQRALERRLARQHLTGSDPSDSQSVVSSADQPSAAASVNNVSTDQDEKPEDLHLSSRHLPCPLSTDAGPPAECPSEPSAGPPAESPPEPSAEPPAESPSEPSAEPPAESPSEPSAGPPAESPPEPPAEPPAECPSEPSAEPPAESPPEPPAEPPAESPPCEEQSSEGLGPPLVSPCEEDES